jgi:hypothetical protein
VMDQKAANDSEGRVEQTISVFRVTGNSHSEIKAQDLVLDLASAQPIVSLVGFKSQ